MYKAPAGPSAFFDIDETLIMWRNPTDADDGKRVTTVFTRDIAGTFLVNEHNLDYLKKLAQRGHAIILWSQGGVDWAAAVAKALDIEHLVSAVLSKPTYYIDDIQDSNKFIGKYVYYNEDGTKIDLR